MMMINRLEESLSSLVVIGLAYVGWERLSYTMQMPGKVSNC
jgi:hypothetical protein